MRYMIDVYKYTHNIYKLDDSILKLDNKSSTRGHIYIFIYLQTRETKMQNKSLSEILHTTCCRKME